jgi:methyl-accepting chemotaxis protein
MNSPVIQESQLQEVELQAINAALNRVQAVIEFRLDGTILHANDNFLCGRLYAG